MARSKCFKIIGVVIISLLEALGWHMAMGGTAKLHNNCNDKVDDFRDNYSGYFEISDSMCSDDFRSVWWSVFFQCFVLLGVAIFVAANAPGKFRVPLVAFLVLTTSRTMREADNSLKLKQAEPFYLSETAVDAATGGFVLMSMMNFLLIAFVGSTGVPNVNVMKLNNRLKAMMSRPHQPHAAAPVGATPGPTPLAPMPTAPPISYSQDDRFNSHPQLTPNYQEYPHPPYGGKSPHA